MAQAPLSHYLELTYPYTVVADDGSFFIEFPDLPGCMTQVEDPSEIAAAADEIRTLWIETEYERGADIPEPTRDDAYSGRFIMRVPRSLHRKLAQAARQEGMSLNAYVLYLLSERQAVAAIASQLGDPGLRIDTMRARDVQPNDHPSRTRAVPVGGR